MGRKRLFTKAPARLRAWSDEDDYRLALVELLAEVMRGQPDDEKARMVALGLLSEGVDLRDDNMVAAASADLRNALLNGDADFAAKVADYTAYYHRLHGEHQKRHAELVTAGKASADYRSCLAWTPPPSIEAWIIRQYLNHSPQWEPRPIDFVDRYERDHYPETVDRKTIARACKAMGLLTDTAPGR